MVPKARTHRKDPFIKQICDLASMTSITSCAYCGLPASDKEHVIPKAYKENSDTVPSCRECNLMAGCKVFGGFHEKRDYIRYRIETRYEKVMNLPLWTKGEINELSGNLKNMMVLAQKAKEITVRRLLWLNGKGMIP